MNFIHEKNYVWILVIVCFFIFFMNLDVLYPNIMEARNFITAREMVTDDNWLLTTMNGEPRYEKPPLPTWLAAISGMLFSFNNLMALRIPSAIITLILVLFSYRFGVYFLKDKKQAFINSLILATSFYIIFAGRNGTWDIFAHGFMMIGIYYIFQFFSSSEKIWRNAILAGICIGVSFMSKGPVSHFALFLPFLIAYSIVYKYSNFQKKWGPLIGLVLVTALISVWWPYYISVMDGETATAIANKETTAWQNRNVRPFYYYWSFFVQSGAWTVVAFVSLLYPYLKTRVENLKAYKFSLFWTLAAVILLSLIPEKKSRYLLPVLIPLAYTTSFFVMHIFRAFTKRMHTYERVPVYLNFGLIGLAGVAFPIVGFIFLQDKLDGFYFSFILTSIALVLIGFFILKYLYQHKIQQVFYLIVFFLMTAVTFGFPLANAFLENPKYNSLRDISRKTETEKIPVYMFNIQSPELVWDYGGKVPLLHSHALEIPKEPTFKTLVMIGAKKSLEKAFPNAKITYLETFDLNPVDETNGGYKDRLRTDMYLVEK
ncbi:undecaprenyl phosphate-alpha-4-amino-4-deoxy-L-arabinose arabinosyl transferase [Kordia sp. SMS9]|uniref:phospholipid carrier-dependent glycosyltransferase n=1 Tax=Kordia sp. SMS9 TaxID=2282170 RepID=UPI000E0DA5DF|nr:phospholipid carrier-dependent glycosyltransferase [Kordia sp. SMS9]AXG71928.1 undecaprenyl phosphate-alpha-4-amino-4-deoxy-L-arabinose arabinosyl transferase [Kordia sp. SMS9]